MINKEEFERRTLQGIMKSLDFSYTRLDVYDPDYLDPEGRKWCRELIQELRDAVQAG